MRRTPGPWKTWVYSVTSTSIPSSLSSWIHRWKTGIKEPKGNSPPFSRKNFTPIFCRFISRSLGLFAQQGRRRRGRIGDITMDRLQEKLGFLHPAVGLIRVGIGQPVLLGLEQVGRELGVVDVLHEFARIEETFSEFRHGGLRASDPFPVAAPHNA